MAPAQTVRGPTSRAWTSRAFAAVVAATLLLTPELTAPPAAEATNWSQRIASVRGSQLYYEGAMRSADLQLRSLKHAARRAHHKLVRARRHLARARDEHAAARSGQRVIATQLQTARARLASRIEPPATPDDLASLAMMPAIATSLEATEGVRADGGRGPDGSPADAVATAALAELPAGLGLRGARLVADALAPDAWRLRRSSARTGGCPASRWPTSSRSLGTVRRIRGGRQAPGTRRGSHAPPRPTRHAQRAREGAYGPRRSRGGMRSAAGAGAAPRPGWRTPSWPCPTWRSGAWPRRRRCGRASTRRSPGRPSGESRRAMVAPASTSTRPVARARTSTMVSTSRATSGRRSAPLPSASSPTSAGTPGTTSSAPSWSWSPIPAATRRSTLTSCPGATCASASSCAAARLIAYMGSTGKATGVHLHLEMRRGRTTLDPLDVPVARPLFLEGRLAP